MRKLLVAVIAAAALFAVGAFAASFTVQSEDIASGSDGVAACAPYVDIDFDDPTASSAGEWQVSGATARFYTTTGESPTAASACDGYRAQLAMLAPGSVSFTGDGPVSEGAVHFGFGTPYAVSAITKASVVVDGKILTADVPPASAG